MNFLSVDLLGQGQLALNQCLLKLKRKKFYAMISTRLAAQLTITHVQAVSTAMCPVTYCEELYRHPSPPSLRVSPTIEVCTQSCCSSRQCMFLLWVEQLH